MTPGKIAVWVGVLASVAGAFVTIPQLAAILLVVGLVVGWDAAREDSVRIYAGAIALNMFAKNLEAIPAAGTSLAAVYNNMGAVTAGAAIMVISKLIVARLMPPAKA